jgi:hypothetical protein
MRVSWLTERDHCGHESAMRRVCIPWVAWRRASAVISVAAGLALGCGGSVNLEPEDSSPNDVIVSGADGTMPPDEDATPSDRTVPVIDRTAAPEVGPPRDVTVIDETTPLDAGPPSDVIVEDAAPPPDAYEASLGDSPPYDAPYDDSSGIYDGPTYVVYDVAYIPIDAPCGPATCLPGCCDRFGQCVLQPSYECGVGGAKCGYCEQSAGNVCLNGACVRPQPNCDPSNCGSGCCLDPNTCSTGELPAACGRNGDPCQRCDISQGCNGGRFGDGGCGLAQPPPCGADCAGCCVQNVCAVGTQAVACGANANDCMNCWYADAQGQCTSGRCQR